VSDRKTNLIVVRDVDGTLNPRIDAQANQQDTVPVAERLSGSRSDVIRRALDTGLTEMEKGS